MRGSGPSARPEGRAMARARDREWDRDHPRCAGFTACAIAPGRSARAGRPYPCTDHHARSAASIARWGRSGDRLRQVTRAIPHPTCPKCMIIIHLSHRGTSPRTDRKGPTVIAYRMQDAGRPLADLLDVEQQYSFPMSNDDEKVRHGVSGCESLAGLAAYIACHAIEADMPMIVVIEGQTADF